MRTYGNRLREADELDTHQRIAGVKRKASHDVNVTDCTLSIGDFLHMDGKDPIHDLTRFNKIAIQGTHQMAVDKEALICLSRFYSYYFK